MFSRKVITLTATVLIWSLIVFFPHVTTAAPEKVKITDLEVGSGLEYKISEGLEAGAVQYYIDRDYVITVMPEELEGIQWIMTANDDKNSMGDDFLTFTVAEPAVVWIAHDSRGEEEKGGIPPQWLTDGFERVFDPKTNPDFTLTVTDGNMATFNLWKQLYDKGEVVLGGNADEPAAGHGSNYLVLVEKDQSFAVQPQDKLSITWGKIKAAQ